MSKLLALAAVPLIGLASAACAAGDEDDIVAIETAWTKAYVDHDPAAIEGLFPDDWSSLDDGKRDTKAQLVAMMADRSVITRKAENYGIKVRFLGDDIAVAQGFERDLGGKRGAKPSWSRHAWTDVFQKRDGKWMVVASQIARVRP